MRRGRSNRAINQADSTPRKQACKHNGTPYRLFGEDCFRHHDTKRHAPTSTAVESNQAHDSFMQYRTRNTHDIPFGPNCTLAAQVRCIRTALTTMIAPRRTGFSSSSWASWPRPWSPSSSSSRSAPASPYTSASASTPEVCVCAHTCVDRNERGRGFAVFVLQRTSKSCHVSIATNECSRPAPAARERRFFVFAISTEGDEQGREKGRLETAVLLHLREDLVFSLLQAVTTQQPMST